ncbi:gamma-glutamyl-gamma-aminobutyrate hydrolase family protein [Marivibrio halodurans]|uniref:Gamma-glutamyl-gamma-aminobutyrate hydrolase family protein n=1 Tax=Marivibrio halodurans TaxID=2039722 RepID=A0A8J7V3G5_9PROT|nr:gamma-glutamyl-gamma-aminobutyrate hydrolase family protein [Marivibrio halodurans]
MRKPAFLTRSRPLIGVTGSRRGGLIAWNFHRFTVWRAGGWAVRLTPRRLPRLEEVAAKLDGLIVGGGDDIGPGLYGGSLEPEVRLDPERDELELRLLDLFAPTGRPVLGVCRGAQMINAHLGGTLVHDIYDQFEDVPRMRTPLPAKHVHFEPDSRLRAILGRKVCKVNSLHHQAVCDLGRGLRVVGRDRWGVVQAIEGIGDRFLIGVQWHPEFLIFTPAQQRLYRSLISAASAETTGARPADIVAPGMKPAYTKSC